jgi:hypothetical protein
MRLTIERLVERLTNSLSGRSEIECVTVGEAAENDILDPYFSLIIDAYYREGLPSTQERLILYGNPEHFETAPKGAKDRFFIDDVPVHVNYNSVADIAGLIDGIGVLDALVRETGTHRLYRLCHCRLLFSRSDWHARAKTSLLGLEDPFWIGLKDAYREKMGHFLSDIGASTIRGDAYFAIVSTSEFLKYAVSALLALNKRFEPAHRFISQSMRNLPVMPENFLSRWDILLRNDGELTPSRKYEIAKLLAMSVFELL